MDKMGTGVSGGYASLIASVESDKICMWEATGRVAVAVCMFQPSYASICSQRYP